MLGACAPSVKASAWESESFTRAVYKSLKKGRYNVLELHAYLTDRRSKKEYGLTVDPYYKEFSSYKYKSIKIERANIAVQDVQPAEKLRQLDLSDARVLIIVTLKDSALHVKRQYDEKVMHWKQWFRHSPPDIQAVAIKVCNKATLDSLYESSSCVSVWSMPIWLWNAMRDNASYKYMGVVRSENVALKLLCKPYFCTTMIPI